MMWLNNGSVSSWRGCSRLQSRLTYQRKLRFEPLEDRSLLSVYLVNTVQDAPTGPLGTTLPGGELTLRQAVYDANNTPGDNTINFDASLAGETVTLTAGELDLTSTTGATTIDATDLTGGVTVSGNNASRVFDIGSGATVSVSGMRIAGGNVDVVDYSSGGGGIENTGALTITDCTIFGNSAYLGGGITNLGRLTITNSAIDGNSTTSYDGGGVYNGGTLTITNSTIDGNSSPYVAGGISNAGNLTITNSTIDGNSTTSYDAGGIYNGGTLTITNSTIDGNSSHRDGGGIGNSGTITITDSTISGNSAGGFGGGICNWSGTITVYDNTVADNSASYGGGIYNDNASGATTTLANTIVAANAATTVGPDIDGTVTADYCLIKDTTNATINTDYPGSNITGVDPLLGPLADNGGPTQTMALLPGSPAIDAGSNALAVDSDGNPLTTDQRGCPRIANGRVDIGAYETQINTIYLMPDPLVSGQNILCVRGTSGNDIIRINSGGNAYSVSVMMNGVARGTFGSASQRISRIVAHGLDGNDVMSVAPSVTLPAWLYGDDGNDMLTGGGGPTYLFGGSGSDILIGGKARSILIGGAGRDILIGGTGDAILIGGTTSYDPASPTDTSHDAALLAIMNEWSSRDSYAARVAYITGRNGTIGLNGSYYLNASTVFDDHVVDVLIGNAAAMDLFFRSPGDLIIGRHARELPPISV